MSKNKTTTAPKGLTVTRSWLTFVCSWKTGETYKSQKFGWKITGMGDGVYHSVDIGKSTTSKTIWLDGMFYYPYVYAFLTYFKFRVKGDADKKTASDWKYYQFDLGAPYLYSVTAAPSDSRDDTTTFSWSAGEDANHPIVDVEYQTQLTREGALPNWAVGSSSVATSGSIPIQESAADVSSGSCTRWVRCRARGPAGPSGWAEAYRTYAQPAPAVNVGGSVSVQDGGMNVTATWSQSSSFAYPVDSTEAQYAIAVPVAGMRCPSGVSFTKLAGLSGPGGVATGFIPRHLDEDECLFVKVKATHLVKTNESVAAMILAGKLKEPTITNIEQDESTFRATITAENKSGVPDSFLVVQYRTGSAPDQILTCGIIEHGETSTTVQCPDWSAEDEIEFGVYAVVGTATQVTRPDNVTEYTISHKKMDSGNTVWQGGAVPHEPRNVRVSTTDIPGTVRVEWDWSWPSADSAVISWADHEDAWESTDKPEEFTIENFKASAWNVSGLEIGRTWHFRVKLMRAGISGSWSATISKDLGSAPNVPLLMLSEKTITVDGSVTATWGYVSNDGTGQLKAKVCEVTIGDELTYGEPIAETTSEQHVTLYAKDLGWNIGETHQISVMVWSQSGHRSEWSAPIPVTVASPLTCEISDISIVEETIDADGTEITQNALKEMPLTVTVTGADAGHITTLAIERAEAYFMEQPDETEFTGYDRETIFLMTQTGDAEITISPKDLVGRLDDGAKYRVVASVQDDLGQVATAEKEFTVNWAHKATIPEGTVVLDGYVAVITPTRPAEGYEEGDTCDIYRLSADRPELVIKAAELGEAYVDPYPAIGERGGYRLVYRTRNGDFVTPDNSIAWTDYDSDLKLGSSLIDFGGEQIELKYNLKLSSKWRKDFKQTKYLGGSVIGDWNAGSERTSSASGVMVSMSDSDSIAQMRRLADYPGLCHVRTPDGSSYSADIQVSENRSSATAGKIVEFDLDITRIDPEVPDGVLASEWYNEEGE